MASRSPTSTRGWRARTSTCEGAPPAQLASPPNDIEARCPAPGLFHGSAEEGAAFRQKKCRAIGPGSYSILPHAWRNHLPEGNSWSHHTSLGGGSDEADQQPAAYMQCTTRLCKKHSCRSAMHIPQGAPPRSARLGDLAGNLAPLTGEVPDFTPLRQPVAGVPCRRAKQAAQPLPALSARRARAPVVTLRLVSKFAVQQEAEPGGPPLVGPALGLGQQEVAEHGYARGVLQLGRIDEIGVETRHLRLRE